MDLDWATHLAKLAEAMNRIAAVLEKHYAQRYPERGEVREAIVTHRQTEEEALRASQGESEDSDQAWSKIGPREAKFEEDQRRREANRAARKRGA
jgi:hypothetical protein